MENITSKDWIIRKISIDIIYALSVLLPKRMIRFKKHLLIKLNTCAKDKSTHVREASRAAIKILKEIKISTRSFT
jgi:hypothetical protein